MGERDWFFCIGLEDVSGLFLGALLLLVDDAVPLGMVFFFWGGGGGFEAGLELLILLFLESYNLSSYCFTC